MDTGADVTLIAKSEWPSDWELEPVSGFISGIGGVATSWRAKKNVVISGPEGATEKRALDIPRLNWKQDHPVWVDQWPLPEEKLHALEILVEEQLSKGHIVPSNSPWNTPLFVIKKPGKDKWRLLQDLRRVNEVIEDFGPLQPGMPSPMMLPRNWPLAVIDIKDCFFNIPLHPADAPRFAFSVPSLNRQAPLKRYHWLVLPQGMKNSPSICQWYVAAILSPIRERFPDSIILHYMDYVLLCAKDQTDLEDVLKATMNAIEEAGFEIQPEKIQLTSPWNYLGLRVCERTVTPQQVVINTNPRTLNKVQQLCASINWVRPLLGISSEDLAPLFNLLRGDSALSSPRDMTPEARDAVIRVQEALSSRQAHRFPLQAVTVFTDGSGSSHKSVMTWKDPRTQKWESDVRVVEGSPQIAELAAVVRAFEKFKDQPLNLVTDSAYVAGVEDCDSRITDWSRQKQILMSIFLPWVAAAKALGELSHLECWMGKQVNLTSAVLSDLLEDEETIRKATLQNRAAIDFLLLAHGHGYFQLVSGDASRIVLGRLKSSGAPPKTPREFRFRDWKSSSLITDTEHELSPSPRRVQAVPIPVWPRAGEICFTVARSVFFAQPRVARAEEPRAEQAAEPSPVSRLKRHAPSPPQNGGHCMSGAAFPPWEAGGSDGHERRTPSPWSHGDRTRSPSPTAHGSRPERTRFPTVCNVPMRLLLPRENHVGHFPSLNSRGSEARGQPLF
ncbi:uncharacterized protein [Sylvia atricapilla]|uniref:uncharacterized protein n=1 Tax=Sylvia atricapilla TaxID=48155 RepID=UPI0033968CF8